MKREEGREVSATPAAVVPAAAPSGPQNNMLLSAVINTEQDFMVNKSKQLNSVDLKFTVNVDPHTGAAHPAVRQRA